jgi:hypothetical protein
MVYASESWRFGRFYRLRIYMVISMPNLNSIACGVTHVMVGLLKVWFPVMFGGADLERIGSVLNLPS